MMTPLRTLAAISAGFTVATALALTGNATAGDLTPDASTLQALPQCTAITDLNCQATVYNIAAGDSFVQVVNGAAQVSDVWPFRNPTAGPIQEHLTDTEMFPSGYDGLEVFYAAHRDDDWKIQKLHEHVTAARDRAAQEHARVTRLRAEVRHLRREIRQLRHHAG